MMDGWEFYKVFLKDFPQFKEKTKIFILSSSINPVDVVKANQDNGIVSFLSKPLIDENLRVVNSLLGI
jgi:CheY-like chemotaxis protein